MSSKELFTNIDKSVLEPFRKIYIGFSGGADSTALLVFIQNLAKNLSIEVEAIHFEHGVRGEESIEDANWCEKFCEVRNISFRKIDLNLGSNIANMEAAARTMRLEKWREIVNSKNEAVALGQHADDRVENLFLRLMRGSNVTGLTSLRSSQKIGDITFLRPLIAVRRSEIEAFLQASAITDWRTDQTNHENRYRRNFIRNKLIPMLNAEFPNSDKALLKSISALENDATYLEKSAEDIYRKVSDKSAISAKYFSDIHLALRPRILRLWFNDICGYDLIPTGDFLARFNDTVANLAEKPISIPLNGNVSLLFERNTISVTLQDGDVAELLDITWNWRTQPEIDWNGVTFSAKEIDKVAASRVNDKSCNCVYFEAALIPDKLIVRHRKDGDRMIPFAKKSSVKLKKLLQGTDLTTSEKQNFPIVALHDNTVIWIPGVRRANFANINQECQGKVVQLSILNPTDTTY